MKRLLACAAIATSLLTWTTQAAWAEGDPSKHSPGLSLAQAVEATTAAVKSCAESGYHVSAAVVDRSGVLLSLSRHPLAGPHTVDSSQRKAYTAASLKESTNKLASLIAAKPELQALRDMNDSILILGGGLPIRINGQLVGGIGVGGAPGAHLDEVCVIAGLKVIDVKVAE